MRLVARSGRRIERSHAGRGRAGGATAREGLLRAHTRGRNHTTLAVSIHTSAPCFRANRALPFLYT